MVWFCDKRIAKKDYNYENKIKIMYTQVIRRSPKILHELRPPTPNCWALWIYWYFCDQLYIIFTLYDGIEYVDASWNSNRSNLLYMYMYLMIFKWRKKHKNEA